ncbi:hypothetical protein GJ496_011576 [Pomphorhynchus laevis]|nr:hypothetical protein GJ496_011576 [Pomphorhynchus laevis]
MNEKKGKKATSKEVTYDIDDHMIKMTESGYFEDQEKMDPTSTVSNASNWHPKNIIDSTHPRAELKVENSIRYVSLHTSAPCGDKRCACCSDMMTTTKFISTRTEIVYREKGNFTCKNRILENADHTFTSVIIETVGNETNRKKRESYWVGQLQTDLGGLNPNNEYRLP